MKNIELTTGEFLFFERRSLNLTQKEMAQNLGISNKLYNAIEQGDRSGEIILSLIDLPHRILEPHELCILHRRRSKLTQARVAKKLGICRWWLVKQELGQVSCKNLLAFWESREINNTI